MLKQKIQNNLVEAMRARNEILVSTLRMLLAAIKNTEIEKKKKIEGLSDEEIVEVIMRQVKQHKDSIEQYKAGGRDDLVAKEEAELKILREYMPEQMGEDEIRDLVKQTISETGASGPSEMGKVMGALMPKVKGRADGGLVSRIVKEELGGLGK